MKNIILVETKTVGHHPSYLKMYCDTLLGLGYKIILFYPRPNDILEHLSSSNNYKNENFITVNFQDSQNIVLRIINRIIPKIGTYFIKLKRWFDLQQKISELHQPIDIQNTIVFLMQLEYYIDPLLSWKLIDKYIRFEWTGIYFHPKHLRFNGYNHQKKQDNILKSNHCKAFAILDEGILNKFDSNVSKPFLFPDISNNSLSANTELVNKLNILKNEGKKIIGVMGALNTKKHPISLLLNIADQNRESNWVFAFIGNLVQVQNFKLKHNFEKNHENCFFHLKEIVDESEYNKLFSLFDICMLVRNDFYHSSNSLNKASIFKIPVIVNGDGCLGERVTKYNLGEVVYLSDEYEITDAIKKIFETDNYAKNCHFDEYAANHSLDVLKVQISGLLNEYN